MKVKNAKEFFESEIKKCHWCGKSITDDNYQFQSFTGRYFHGDPNNGCSREYLESEGLA